jgi:thiol:disulfide interchange protein DsbA
MNRLASRSSLLAVVVLGALFGCSKAPVEQPAPAAPEQTTTPVPPAATPEAPAAAADAGTTTEATAQAEASAPVETVTEMADDPATTAEAAPAPTVQPSLRMGGAPSSAPTSARFKEGTSYKKLVPAQPTNVSPGKVEVTEVFWYGCGHCYALDPALESWKTKGKPAYVEFVRVPAMWNDATRMHARVFYTAELLGKLDELHTLIFREIHANGNQLNTVEKISTFFREHGVSADEFQKAFSSFAVESKLQRADFLNRRYRIEAVPTVVVNGKYTTGVGDAGGEQPLFALIGELAAHEHGG